METVLSKKLGSRIRELRISKKITQSDLADSLGMERSNLTRIENGKQRPNDENLAKIAGILGVEIKDLFDFSHIKSKDELIDEITDVLYLLSENELMFCHKTIMNLKQMK